MSLQNNNNVLQPRRQNFEVHPRRLLPSMQNYQPYNILLKEHNSNNSDTLPPLAFIRPSIPIVYSESPHCYTNSTVDPIPQPPPLLPPQPESTKNAANNLANVRTRVGSMTTGVSKRPASSVAKRNARERNRVRQVKMFYSQL